MRGLICFSLWGDSPLYWHGAYRNAIDAKIFFPGWIVRFYVDNQCSVERIAKLHSLGSQVCLVSRTQQFDGMFWRFLGAVSNDADFFMSRDADSRFSVRESFAVNDWIRSGKAFHIMRDHPFHSVPILGGMWGCSTKLMRQLGFEEKMRNWNDRSKKGVDQDFLSTIYSQILPFSIEHYEFIHFGNPSRRAFPTPRIGLEFIGEIFDETDCPNQEHREVLRNAINRG